VSGARAVRKSVLQDFPEEDISISLVWIQMPGFNDDERTARAMAQTLRDPRVRHFYDPFDTHRAGKAFAKEVLREGMGPAWDIYLFYERGMTWVDRPPAPVEWVHQLGGGRRADPERFRTGEDLINELHDAMQRLRGEGRTLPEP
jgi:hypothetical protein